MKTEVDKLRKEFKHLQEKSEITQNAERAPSP